MTTVLDVEMWVHYGFLWVMEEDEYEWPDLVAARGGQTNGLLGAAFPGVLSMVTGLHTGELPVRVEALDEEPPLDDVWEEVVEASFVTRGPACSLQAFQSGEPFALPAGGAYRARWCASGMDAAREQDTRMPEDPALDRYLLQLWPAPPAPDAVLRRRSEIAAYWHQVASETPPPPPPPPPPTAEELAEAAAAEEARAFAAEEEWRRQITWGGVVPSARLEAAGGRAGELAQLDHDLAEQLVRLDPAAQRDLAAWAVDRAWRDVDADVLARVGDLGQVLAAVRTGRALPTPFSDLSEPWDVVYPPSPDVVTVAEMRPWDEGRPPERVALDPPAAATDATLHAGDPNPAAAVVGAVVGAATAHVDPSALLAEVRAQVALRQR